MAQHGGPIILPLADWAERHLKEVVTAGSKTDFDDAFDAFFAPNVSVTVNGKHMSRAAYQKMLWGEEDGDSSGTVAFMGTVAVIKNPKDAVPTGEVGVFYEANITRRGLLSSNKITSSLNMVVEHAKRKHGEPSEFDGRQATVVNQVFTEVPTTSDPRSRQ